MTDHEAGALLAAADGDDGAAAHQGSFFGLACALREAAPPVWVSLVLEDWPAERRDDGTTQALARGAHAWLRALTEGQLDFALLLGEDTLPLASRTDALSQWCQGFLFGLAHGGIKEHAALPGEIPEFVDDVLAISQAVADGEATADEVAFFELTEYLRVGVQLVFDEMAATDTQGTTGTH